MSQIQVITPSDLGSGLKIQNQKVVVDSTSLPVDVHLAGVALDKETNILTFTLSNDQTIKMNVADFLTVDTDTTLVSGTYSNGTLTLVDSKDASVEVDLTTISTGIETLKTQVSEIKNKAEPSKIQVVDLSGNELGFLISNTPAGSEVVGP